MIPFWQIENSNNLAALIGRTWFDLTDHLKVISEIPESMVSASKSFTKRGVLHWQFFLVLIACVLVAIGFKLWFRYQQNKKKIRKKQGDPDRLFSDALDRVDLSSADRMLLREMVEGARLCHPTMCLLSPGLLDWSRQLWLEEKGGRIVTTQKFRRIDDISMFLHDHRTPTGMIGRHHFNRATHPKTAMGSAYAQEKQAVAKKPVFREKATMIHPLAADD